MPNRLLEGLYLGDGIITTVNEVAIEVHNPKPENFFIDDIAQGLANTCRWNGQIRKHYTVGAHSLHVCSLVPDDLKIQALFHDASEAYIADIPRPVKALLPDYKKLENSFMTAISKRFGFAWPVDSDVKTADKKVLEIEYSALRKGGYELMSRHPHQVYLMFKEKAAELLGYDAYQKLLYPIGKEADNG